MVQKARFRKLGEVRVRAVREPPLRSGTSNFNRFLHFVMLHITSVEMTERSLPRFARNDPSIDD